MSEIPHWRETNGPEVWLVAGDDSEGVIDDLHVLEADAIGQATPPAVLGANADAGDAARIEQLIAAGYSRTFSWVRLEIETAGFEDVTAANTRPATLADARAMLALSESVWGDRLYATPTSLDGIRSWLGRSDLSLFHLAHDEETLVAYWPRGTTGPAGWRSKTSRYRSRIRGAVSDGRWSGTSSRSDDRGGSSAPGS